MLVHSADRYPAGLRCRAALMTFLAPLVGSAQVASDAVQVPIEEVVVVGTRALPRSIEDSSVPVDVIGSEDFEDQAGFDMSNLIRSTVPSFHVSDNPSRDLAALLRPVNLRGAGTGSYAGADEQQAPAPGIGDPVDLQRRLQRRPGAGYFGHSRHCPAAHGGAARRSGRPVRLRRHRRGAEFCPEGRGRGRRPGGPVRRVHGAIRRGHDHHRRQCGMPLADSGFANFSFEYGESAPTDRSVQHRDATALIDLGIPNVAVPAKPGDRPPSTTASRPWRTSVST